MAALTLSSAVLASKFRGCLVGALLGDCIGVPFEGDSPISKRILNNYLSNLMSGGMIDFSFCWYNFFNLIFLVFYFVTIKPQYLKSLGTSKKFEIWSFRVYKI